MRIKISNLSDDNSAFLKQWIVSKGAEFIDFHGNFDNHGLATNLVSDGGPIDFISGWRSGSYIDTHYMELSISQFTFAINKFYEIQNARC